MDDYFENFMLFCEGYLDESNKKLLTLAKKRYHECDEEYKHSQELFDYICCTQTKILAEESRFYVHLRDFLSILKENKARDESVESNLEAGVSKRVHESSESESDVAFSAKRRKIQKYDEDPNGFETEDFKDDNFNGNNEETVFSKPYDIHSNSSSLQKKKENYQQEDSDEEIERSPDNEGVDEDDDENEIWESEIVNGGDISESESLAEDEGDVEESEGENVEVDVKTKEETDSDNMSDSDEGGRHGNDKVKVSEVPDPDSESEGCSNISRAETEGSNSLYPSSGDKVSVIGTKSSTYIDNISSPKSGDSKEVTEIFNISSETEVIGYEDKQKKTVTSSGKCAEKDVSVNEGEEKHLCITIKHVKGAKKDGFIAGNPYLKDSSAISEISKAKKTDDDKSSEREASECESNDDDDDDVEDDGNNKKLITNKIDHSHLDEDMKSYIGTDEDENNEKVTKEFSKTSHALYGGLSTDDEDEDSDDLKAKKFREKCKKKYVTSVGKKIDKPFTATSPSKDHSKSNFVHKIEKDKSPRKKHTPQNSPKCKKKLSPNKSPIIIFTDSESDDEDGGIEGFKKKFKEKCKKRIQFESHLTGKHDQSPVKKGHRMEIDNDSGSGEEMCHSGKENHHFTKSTDGGHIATGNKDKIKQEKKRVNLVTEELYSSKSDSVFKHHRDNEFGDFKGHGKDKTRQVNEEKKSPKQENSGEEKFDKEQYKCNEKSPKQMNNDREDENPGPSSTSDAENAQKKGSSRQIRKLEALLESIRNKIEKVRMKELDLDDLDSDVSDYLLEDKLQRKFMKVWDKLCELHKAIKSTGRPTDKYFRYQGTRYPDINRKLEKFINKKKVFPDYHDVRSIIMKVNREKKLHLKSREIDDLSREAFTDIGNQLQKRRKKDFTSTFFPQGAQSDSLSLLDDPALLDIELKKKLDANRKSAKSNMEKVVEKYAGLQYQVGDKTEEESEEEEEEEEELPNVDIDLDQLSGVDNTDSDKDNVDDNIHTGDTSRDNTWESGPCLEIENLESGQKSTFSSDNPDDVRKLTPVKSALKRDVGNKDNKERHFCEQLGLFRTPSKDETKDKNENCKSPKDDNDCSEPNLPPPRIKQHCPQGSHPPPEETDPFPKRNTESNNPCNPLKADPSQDDVTVMILSDNEDDEIISPKETEKVIIRDTSCNKSGNISEPSPSKTDAPKDSSISPPETSPKVPTTPKVSISPKVQTTPNVSISPKISESVTESSPSLSINAEAAVTTEADAKNTSDVSNVTIITDDEDEEEGHNVSDDQSLSLKIVSSHHVSLNDLSKLHGEGESDVETGNVSGKGKPIECATNLNSSSESLKESKKLSSEVVEDIHKKSSPILSVSKEKPSDIKKLSSKIDNNITEKINEVLNSEPDVMIIEDIENEVLPMHNKALNTQVQKRIFVRKPDNSPNNIQRNHPNSNKVNRLKNSNAQVPFGLHSTTSFTVSNKNNINPLQPFRNDTSKQSNAQTVRRQNPPNVGNTNAVKVNSPVAANSNIISPVSSKNWQKQSQKSPTNLYRGTTGSKTFQQFPHTSNLSNTNKFMGGNTKVNTLTSPNNMRFTPNKVQQNEFGRTNLGISKAMAPMNMNSKMRFTSNNSLKVQQQKFGRDTSVSNSSTNYSQGFKQMNTGFKANQRSPTGMHSNNYQPYPNATNKNWNAKSPKQFNPVQKNFNPPQGSPRFAGAPFKATACSTNVHVPSRTSSSQFRPNFNKGFNIQGQNTQRFNQSRNNSFMNSQQKNICNQNRVKKVSDSNTRMKPASTSPKVIDDIVVIDCEEVEKVPRTKSKPSKQRVKSAAKMVNTDEVICIDDPSELEQTNEDDDAVCIVSENIVKTSKECKKANDLKKTESKRTHDSSGSSPKTKDVSTSKENFSEGSTSTNDKITEKSQSLHVDSESKSEKTSVPSTGDENIVVKCGSNESNSKNELQGKDNNVALNKDEKSKANAKDVERTNSIEIERKSPDDEVRSIPDIFEGSLGTVDSNECESIESYHDSEVLENSKPHEEVFDEFKKDDESSDFDSEESESSEIFTAVKLETVEVDKNFGKEDKSLESTSSKTVENKLVQGSEGLSDEAVVAGQKTEFEKEMKSNIKQSPEVRKDKDASVEIRTDLLSNTSTKDEDKQTSDNEDEVSCGIQDDDSISSTSCDVDSHPNVKLGPDIRNKLNIQLKKAMVKSKPEQEKRSQVKPQDIIVPHARTAKPAHWIEEDENASLIETYQEPDSTPYSLDDNQISSSSNENIIVLSDSE